MRLRNVSLVFFSLAFAAIASFAQQVSARPSANASVASAAGSNTNYGKLPLVFEANQGQADPQVKFLLRGRGYTTFLTSGSMVLSLRPTDVVSNPQTSNLPTRGNGSSPSNATMQFRLLGGNRNPVAVGEDPQPGRVNYFLGNDPAKWHTNVPTYGKVRYKNVYPGIDLVYYGNHQQLEYDFAIAPGADPSRIEFEIQGAAQIALDGEGNLVLSTGNGELHFQSPTVYQESNGQRAAVEGGYVVRDSTHIAFHVARYDSSKPLVIDPVLVYSTYLGGSGTEQLTGIAVDSSGSVYVAGYTDSADFPLATLGSLPTNTNHVFVAKLDATGSNLMYADYIGGSSEDYGIALVLDTSNNVYVAGSTESSNFPLVKPYQAQRPGPYTGFLTKVSADGSSLLYSTYLGGSTFDQPTSVGLDGLGQVHVAGYTMSQNFPVVNAFQATASANQDGLYGEYGFLTKFSADGSSLVYSTYLAGNSNVVQDCGIPCWPAPYSSISAVAVDLNGNAYVTGITNTYNFPVTIGAFQTSNSTQQDASIGFVSKFSSAGNLDYSTYFYGSSGAPVEISAVAVDGSGSAYVAGSGQSDGTFPITSTAICDPGTYGYGCSYAFVTKFDPTGSTLLYSTFLGPNNFSSPQAIVVDATGDAYVLASIHNSLFQTNNAIESYANNADLLLVEIDPAATTQLFSTYLGGNGSDSPSGIALDVNGNLYVGGSTDSTDFPTTPGAFQSVLGGRADALVVKISAALGSSVSLNPSSLQYASLPVGSTSQPQTVLLRNLGSSPLLISSITTGGDFAETDNCGSSVPAAGSCAFSVTFTPTAAGSRLGSILLKDNATGSSHVIPLSGIGSGAVAALTPASLVFSSQQVGTSTLAQVATLSNNGTAALNIGGIQVTGDYGQTNNCPAALPASSSCTINITFTPLLAGTRTGMLSVTDNAPGNPHTVGLTGAGADFGVTSSPSSNTVKAGATANYTLTLSPLGGQFNNAVQLTCSGLPALTTCSLSPKAVTPGGNAATVSLKISTTASVARAAQVRSSQDRPLYAIWMQLPGVGFVGMTLVGFRARARRRRMIILLGLMIAVLIFMSGCAGGTGITTPPQSGTTPGTYTVTVTGTSGALQHSLPVTLVVQ